VGTLVGGGIGVCGLSRSRDVVLLEIEVAMVWLALSKEASDQETVLGDIGLPIC
jgi:hypothetical protein